jgi:Flp pilus assembly protein TadG
MRACAANVWRCFKRLKRDTKGLALLELAISLPLLITLCITGAELTNYITVRMRISQLALQLADNAARMGNGSLLSAKTITENDINDILAGAQLQSGGLNLQKNGRVILSDLEPMSNPNTSSKYKIVWQRCMGAKTSHASSFGVAGNSNLDGIGPAGQLVTAQDDNATMFVEVYYVYQPIVGLTRFINAPMLEIASMSVRDRRDLTKIYNTSGAAVSTC